MIDPFNRQIKGREQKVLGILKRFVPGDFKEVAEIYSPDLHAAGFDFEAASVANPSSGCVAALWRSPTVPLNTKPFREVTQAAGDWVFVIDPQFGAGHDSLWIMSYVDNPSQVVKAFEAVGPTQGMLVLKAHQGKFMIAVQALLLKSICKNIKNGNSHYDV